MHDDIKLEPGWKDRLAPEFGKPYFRELRNFVRAAYAKGNVYPPAKLIFRAFDATPFECVKVVILGQDPYHGPGQANGLCFSVNNGVALPPSLKHIFQEIESDLGIKAPREGDLLRWASQGVLLLNAVLTVESGQAGSHQNRGWETFTDAVIQLLNKESKHLVYLLWGSYAQRKGSIIDPKQNLVLTAPHPSPLSAYRGFFGCRHFSKANQYLISQGKNPVNW